MFYLPRDRAEAQGRGWEPLRAGDFPWPLPGDAFWRILGNPAKAAQSKRPIWRRQLHIYVSDPPAWLIAIEGETDPEARHDHVAYLVQAGTDLFALTGRSDVIHDLNERLGGPRPERLLDYVDFFSSFVAGDDGPFLLPRNDAERAEVIAEDSFAADAERAREKLVLQEGEVAAAGDGGPPPWRLELLPDVEDKERTHVGATIIYGDAAFSATFAVAADGAIEMVDDDPLASLQTVTQHRFVEEEGTSWLMRQWGSRKKEPVTAEEFLKRVYQADSMGDDFDCPRLEHLEVEGNVEFPACRPIPWLHCKGVDFRGSVVLDDCEASDRVLFRDCRVLGSFSARRTSFAKSFGLRRCQILALCTDLGPPAAREQDRWGHRHFGWPVALCLDSARINSDLDLERTTCHATLRAKRLSVAGNADFAGLRVMPLVVGIKGGDKDPKWAATSSAVAMDLSDGEFQGALNLGCAFDHTAISQMSALPRHCHRPIVAGVALLEGIRVAGSLWLRGLGVLGLAKTRGSEFHAAHLSLRQARIGGSLQNYGLPSFVQPPPTRILGDTDLTCAQFGNYVELSTFFITGDLDMGALEAQALFLAARWEPHTKPDEEYGGAESWLDHLGGHGDARASSWRYCHVSGGLNLNNARISGGVFGEGLQVLGTMRALDGGSFGSIKIRPLPWLEFVDDPASKGGAKTQVMHRHRPRFGALEIATATINGTVEIFDADVGRHLLVNSTAIAGGLDLYGRETLVETCIQAFREMGYTNREEEMRSFIGGQLSSPPPSTKVGFDPRSLNDTERLSVTGCKIGGNLDLRNARVKASIELGDTHLGGDLSTAQPVVVGGVEGRAAMIFEGGQHAVTPTLNLEGCSAALLAVHGDCIDALAEEQPPENLGEMSIRTECRRFDFDSLDCRGDARLWRLAASRAISGRHAKVGGKLVLYLQGKGANDALIRGSGEGGVEVNLERAEFRQLTLVEPFPRKVLLRGIQVTHWDPWAAGEEDSLDDPVTIEEWEQKKNLMLDLLSHMPTSDPSVYLDVEKHFRSQGYDDQANAVYRALRERQAVQEEDAAGAEAGVWAWLVALSIPLLWVLMQSGLVPATSGLFPKPLDLTTTYGLIVGLLAPWLLAWRFPPQAPRSSLSDWLEKLKLPEGLLRGGALALGIALVFSSEAVRAVLAVAALTFWAHLLLLLPFAIAFKRLRSLVVGRLMQGLGTGYGTSSHRLVMVWLFLLLVPMSVVMHEPRNVEPTLFARGALKVSGDLRPDTEQWQWRWGEPPPIWAWMAVEATVPIITLGAEDKWESADRPPAVLACLPAGAANCRDIVVPFGTSAKQIEAFLRMMGWIFWPLAVGGLAAAFVHRRGQGG